MLEEESFCDAVCDSPVLWLVVAADVGTAQLLYQDPNDVNELDEVHLKEEEKINGCFKKQHFEIKTFTKFGETQTSLLFNSQDTNYTEWLIFFFFSKNFIIYVEKKNT